MSIPSRILITGCTGFVGGYLIEQCSRRYAQAELFGITGSLPTAPVSSALNAIQLQQVDITNRSALEKVVLSIQPDLVFHLAAQSSVAASWKDPLYTLKVNAEGTVHLLEALRRLQSAPRVVLVGSGEQYGMIHPSDNPIREECPFRPANPYAVSKAAQDLYGYQYFAAYHLPILRTRSFNHFGPQQAANFVIASFARQIALIEAGKADACLSVGNLQARRDFLPVEDVVAAYLAIAEQGLVGEAYNVGSGHARSIRAILDLLLALTSKSIEVYEDPALQRPVDVPLLEADTARLRTHTNWQPELQFEVALLNTLNYWRNTIAKESIAVMPSHDS